MKKILIIFSLFCLANALTNNIFSQSPAVPTDRIFDRTYLIQTDTLVGTCFSVIYKGEEFIITVRHLFKKKLADSSSVHIKLYYKKEIKDTDATVYKSKNDSIDIVVLKLPIVTCSKESYGLGGDFILGQDVYFIGYPILAGNIFCTQDITGKIYPLCKKAINSGFVYTKDSTSIVLLDGHNNPGFSGSPVTYYNYFDKQYKITAVISGYFLQENKILGDTTNLLTNPENSGIIKCFAIEHAVEILERIKK